MAVRIPARRPLSCLSSLPKCSRPLRLSRPLSTTSIRSGILNIQNHDTQNFGDFESSLLPPPSTDTIALRPSRQSSKARLKSRSNHPVYKPPPSVRNWCKNPIAEHNAQQIALLDPSGARARLFDPSNPEAAKVGDILHVRTRSGDPFSGVCLSIKKQGVDTAILLRNQLTRVGVEMWFKIYSPNVEGIEVVQRREKRARRARLYYMRLPKHDVGSVQNVVAAYLRERAALRGTSTRSGNVKGRDANSAKKGKKGGKNKK